MTMLDGYSIADKKFISFDHEFDTKDQIQPNGVDLRAGTIYEVQGKSLIPREGKAEAKFSVQPLLLKEGYWDIESRMKCLYYVDFLEYINVPDGYCGIIHTRSSLVRSGIDIVAGIYDTGFRGRLGGCIRAHQDVKVEYGAKLAQITLVKSNFRGHRYSGRYQNTNSQTAITT